MLYAEKNCIDTIHAVFGSHFGMPLANWTVHLSFGLLLFPILLQQAYTSLYFSRSFTFCLPGVTRKKMLAVHHREPDRNVAPTL